MLAKTVIPTGWRRLKPNEYVRPGDRYLHGCVTTGIRWIELTNEIHGRLTARRFGDCIRAKH